MKTEHKLKMQYHPTKVVVVTALVSFLLLYNRILSRYRKLDDETVVVEKYHMALGSSQKDGRYEFIIAILSKHSAYRQFIRKTWANLSAWSTIYDVPASIRIKVLFVIDLPKNEEMIESVMDEDSTYGDIYMLQEGDRETSSTHKILWVLKHISNRFEYKYFLKVAENTLANLPIIIPSLSSIHQNMVLGGSCLHKLQQGIPYCTYNGYFLTNRTVTAMLRYLDREHVNEEMYQLDNQFVSYLVNRIKIKYNAKVKIITPRNAVTKTMFYCGNVKYWLYEILNFADAQKTFNQLKIKCEGNKLKGKRKGLI